jgi:uncharacterized membrane protein YeaQ/YmgE (transglycosylase-associated protein family)
VAEPASTSLTTALAASAVGATVFLNAGPTQLQEWLILGLTGVLLGTPITPAAGLPGFAARVLSGIVSSVVFGAYAGQHFALSPQGTAAAIIVIGTFLHLAIAAVAPHVRAVVSTVLSKIGVKIE